LYRYPNKDSNKQIHTKEEPQLKACKEGGIVRSDRAYYSFDKNKQQINVEFNMIEKKVPVDIRINKISCIQGKTFKCFIYFAKIIL
jgi:hypothetical protein